MDGEKTGGGSAGDPIAERDIEGLKYFDRLLPLLKRLHDDGCRRDAAGNRKLHFDQYAALILLALFNPVVRSLRSLQQASELRNVQRKLGCARASLGSLSEAASVFDPERLQEIIAELAAEVADRPDAKSGIDPRLRDLPGRLTSVDGTLIAALPRIAEASWRKRSTGKGMVKWRLHTHFDVGRGLPTRIDVTPNAGGEHDERAVLERTIAADCLYAIDRGYAKFTLLNQIVARGSSYVCRLRDNTVCEVLEERPLTAADKAARVLSDTTVRLGLSSKEEAQPDHPTRLVTIEINPHVSKGKYRGGSTGPGSDGLLRVATNLLDVPAEIIALVFSHRWPIEIFFRMFKHVLGCRHLLSHRQDGIEIQAYCAIIACLLISLWTGRKPTRRTQEMLNLYWMGWAEEDELEAHLKRLAKHAAKKP